MKHFLLITLFFISPLLKAQEEEPKEQKETTQHSSPFYTSKGYYLSKEYYRRQNDHYEKGKKIKDTLRQVNALINLGDYERLNGKYNLAFDHLWEAEYLQRELNDPISQIKVHRNLGILYNVFGIGKESVSHLEKAKSIALNSFKTPYTDKQIDLLLSCYMNLAIRERSVGNHTLALQHLDTCYIHFHNLKSKGRETPAFLNAEMGYNLLKLGELDESEPYLIKALDDAEKGKQIYTANILGYIGELKYSQHNYNVALNYLNKGLKLSSTQKHEQELEAKILKVMAQVHLSLQQYKKAYNALDKATSIENRLTSARYKSNGELFKVKNSYLTSLSKKNEEILKQKVEIEHEKETKSRLKIIVFLLALLLFLVSAMFYMRIKLKKTSIEKQRSDFKARQIEEKSSLELESKSKELTSYALQLIDKESAIEELLKTLQEEGSPNYKFLKTKHTKGSQNLWNEFNLRFTEVNSAFYERLQQTHPDLSTTEQKHCALIKLNFNTKEMARILNIENHSVHISRSRIRKKIGLNRNDSLDRYINEL